MKHVVHVIDELRMGGAQVYLLRILQEYKKSETIHSSVVCLFGEGEFVAQLKELDIPVTCLHLESQIQNRQYYSAIIKLKESLEVVAPQAILCHLTWSRFIGLPAAWLSGISHRFAIEHGDIYFRSFKWRVLNFVLQFLTDRIIPVSQAMAEWLAQNYGIFAKKMTVLHNAMDTETFSPTPHPVTRETLGIDSKAFLCCTIGMLGTGVNKRVDVAIQAIALARKKTGRDIQLMVCGDGDLRKELEQLAEEQNVAGAIHFLGKRPDIPDLLAISDVFVHCAPFEPFGLVCLEAMWMKKAVIVPDSGGITEIISEGTEGLKYPPLNTEKLADSICTISESIETAIKMGQKGHAKVLSSYTMQTYVKKLNQICSL